MPQKNKNIDGRSLALTIIIGIFIAIMVITLFNLIVSYAYGEPKYDAYCNNTYYTGPFPVKDPGLDYGSNCTFNKSVYDQGQMCSSQGGNPIYEYNDNGCAVSFKNCDMCNTKFNDALAQYNRNTFFIFAIIGFILIVAGLFWNVLLIQIITLPAGAVLVIEAAVKNFDDKLLVIIIFALLIIAATYLALKKLNFKKK